MMLSRLAVAAIKNRRLGRLAPHKYLASGFSSSGHEVDYVNFDIFNPTKEHTALREMVRSFTEKEVDPQVSRKN